MTQVPHTTPPTAPAAPKLFALAWPLLAELLLGFGVGMLGLWLAAHASDTNAAAFALANQWQGAFFLLFRVISMGVSVVVTQSLGAGNRASAAQTALAALGASTWLGAITGAVVFLCAEPLLTVLRAPDALLPVAVPYLQMLALALALDACNATMGAVLRAHLRTRETLAIVLGMHSVHLLLCVPLMQGVGNWSGLGLPGFALALAISRAAGFGAHWVLWQGRLGLAPQAQDLWRVHWSRLGAVLHIGLPGAAENIAYRLAMLFSVATVAGMGTTSIATHSYTMQWMNIIVLFTVALGFSCEILIGHRVGAGRLHQAMRTVRNSLGLGMVVSLGLAVLAAATAPWTLRVFTQDPAIIGIATTLLWINVVLEPGRTCNIVVINALRGAGDARFPVAAGAVSMLVVMAGGSWWLGVHWGLGLAGVWIAYAADEWVRGLIMAWRWFGLGWLPAAKAARRRAVGSA